MNRRRPNDMRLPVLPLLMVACFALAGLSSGDASTAWILGGCIAGAVTMNQ